MKKKQNNLVTKVALIVAIIALLFSIVTLVRAIIIRTGILLAVIQVIGTAVIVTVCAIMLYVLKTNDEDEDDSDEDADEETDHDGAADEEPVDTIDTATDNVDDVSDDDYHFSNFE